jgi:thiamine-monophosphate kinase
VASAALDVSDGLLADLGHIAEMSKVRITLDATALPRASGTVRLWPGLDGIVRAATAGDDYELAFTAESEKAVREASSRTGVAVSRIGRVEAGQGVSLLDGAGREVPVARAGFTHF